MSGTSPSSSKSTPPSRREVPPGELLALPQLSGEELSSLARLESACLSSDGGRLKLEWPALRNRRPGETSDFAYVVAGELIGFVGLYQWRSIALELCGMVHPSWRRRGVGSLLYEAAAAEIARRQPASALMVVERAFTSGRRFASARGGRLAHSEHRMRQSTEPERRPRLQVVRLRRAGRPDAAFVVDCLAAAFEEEPRVLDLGDGQAVDQVLEGTVVIEDPTRATKVGVVRVEREGGVASIYGFAVLPALQGRGYGRAALCALTRRLRRSGVGVVSLEVLSSNDGALHLYESCGFEVIGTEDYYSMPIG